VLAAGEEGYETDTRKSKVGDGTTAWNSLDYAYTSASETVTASEGLTKTGSDIRLGGLLTDTSNQAQVLYESDTAGLLIGPNGGDGGAFQVGPSTAQFTISNASEGHASISAYPALAGMQVASADFSNDNLLLVSPTGIQVSKYPSSRNDTASSTPSNYIYTDAEGTFRSAPLSSLPTGETFKPLSRITVASSTASTEEKESADYVCDGTADNVQINSAIADLSTTGGVVELSAGTFNLASTILLAGDGTTADSFKIALIGAGADTTQLNPASDTHAVTITGTPKVEVANFSVNLLGASDGIHCNAPTSGTGDRRGFWLSSFHDLQFQGDNSTHSGWAMNLENPFRSTFERIQGMNIKNGIWLKSTYSNFNPGNLNFTNCHMDLGIANGTAYYLQSADNGGFLNICTFSECDCIDSTSGSTSSIGWRFKGSGTSYYTTRNILVLRSNVELFNTAVKFEHSDNVEFNGNFINTKNNGTVFDLSSDSVSNYLSAEYIYVDGSTTTKALNDLNTEPQRPNVLWNSRARVETGGTLTLTPSAVTVLSNLAKDTDGSGTYPTQWTFPGTRGANDANVIHTTGNETSTGRKTFETITATASSGDLIIMNATGSNNALMRIQRNGTEMGALFVANGSTDTTLRSQSNLVLTAGQGGTPLSARINSSGLGVATTPHSTLQSGGTFATTTLTVTSNTSIASTYTLRSNSTSALTHTLPTATGCTGRIYVIKNVNTGAVTIATTSSQTIDGATTYSLPTQYKYVTVQSNGTNWDIIANN
jgi:hypothetical protein